MQLLSRTEAMALTLRNAWFNCPACGGLRWRQLGPAYSVVHFGCVDCRFRRFFFELRRAWPIGDAYQFGPVELP